MANDIFDSGVDVSGTSLPSANDPVMQEALPPDGTQPPGNPEIEAPPVQQANAPAPITPAPKEKKEGGPVIMGGLPRWTTIMQMQDFRDKKVGEQNKVRENWLRQLADLNPDVSKDEIRELRKKVYSTDVNGYPVTIPSFKKEKKQTTVENMYDQSVRKITGSMMGGDAEYYDTKGQKHLPEFAPAMAQDKKAVKKATEQIDPYMQKTPLTHAIEKVVGTAVDFYTPLVKKYGKTAADTMLEGMTMGQGKEVKETMKTAYDFWKEEGAFKRAGWATLEEGKKFLEQLQFTGSYVFGGIEGKIEDEKKRARLEGRSAYWRELPKGERIQLIEKIAFNDGYVDINEHVADIVRDKLLPEGYSYEEIDDILVDGMKNKQLPEVEFFWMGEPAEGHKKVDRPYETPISNEYEALGRLFTSGLNVHKAWDAMWNNLNYDIREIKDYNTIRKQVYGKTAEEKYGLWKGMLINIGVTMGLDPAAGPLMAEEIGIKAVGKGVTTGFGTALGKAISGEMGLLDTAKALKTMAAKMPKSSYEDYIDLVIRGLRSDAEFAGKEGKQVMKILDETAELVKSKGTSQGATDGLGKVEDAIDNIIEHGGKVNKEESLFDTATRAGKWMDGTVPQPNPADMAGRTGAAEEAGKYFGGGHGFSPPPGTTTTATKAGKEVIEDIGRTVDTSPTGVPIPDIGKIREAGGKVASDIATEAGRFAEGVSPVGVPPTSKPPIYTGGTATSNTLGGYPFPKDIPIKVDADGITKVDSALDDLARGADEVVETAEEVAGQGVAGAKTVSQEQLSKMRVHDPSTRKALTNDLASYEKVVDDNFSTPVQRNDAWKKIQDKWSKVHPEDEDFSELARVLDERKNIRTGTRVDESTGSDLLFDTKSKHVADFTGEGMKESEKFAVENLHAMNRKKEQELIDKAMAEYTKSGKQITKVASKDFADETISEVGDAAVTNASNRQMAEEGMEIFTEGDEQIGYVSQRLGYFDDWKDSLQMAARSGKTRVKESGKKLSELKSKAKEDWAGYTDKKGELFDQIYKDEFMSNKEKNDLIKMLNKAEDEALKQTKKGAKGFTEEEKYFAEADKYFKKILKRNQSRKSEIVGKKMSDGSIKITRVAHGREEVSYFTPPEHNDGEYLGSIFGMAQKFWERRAMRKAGKSMAQADGAVQEHLKKSYFSIEKQFEDFPIVGRAVKNMYSTMEATEEFGFTKMQAIAKEGGMGRFGLTGSGKTKLKSSDLIDLPLMQENEALFDALSASEKARLSGPLEKVEDFYASFRQLYEDRGVKLDFKQNFKDSLINANRKITETLEGLRDGTVTQVGKKDLADMGINVVPETFKATNKGMVGRLLKENHLINERLIAETDKFKYINIPHAMWFESGFDRAAALKALKIANAHKRATFRIADLIEAGAIKREQVNLFDMMAAYTRRASKDLAMLDVRNAMRKSGQFVDIEDMKKFLPKGEMRDMIKKLRGDGWHRMDPRHYPMFNRGYMHPAMQEWLYQFKHEKLNANWFDKTLSSVKGWQFANPFFLPYYDVMQGAAARGAGLINPIGWGKDMRAAYKLMRDKPRLYWEMMNNGLQSKPMATPFDEFMGKVNRLKLETGFDYINHLGKETGKSLGLKPLYEASWTAAWEMDKMIRISTANYYIRKGMSVADASQLAALIHSDYANVPIKLRRGLNRVLFTGTFKVTMFRLYKEMMKNMAKVPYKALTGRAAELTMQEKQLAKAGYTTVLGIMGGMDAFMIAKGYERDQFARRYYKNVWTPEGPKEDVVVFSSPLTMIPKYWNKLRQIVNENYKDDAMGQVIDTFKWDIHPVYRIGIDLMNNKKDNYDPIYEPFVDSGLMKHAKMAEYTVKQGLQIIKQIGLEKVPEDQQKAWDLYRKDMGYIMAYLTKPTSFQYLRDKSTVKYKKDIQKLQRKFKNVLQDQIDSGRFDPQKAYRAQQELHSRIQKIVKLIQTAEMANDRSVWERWKGGASRPAGKP